MLHSQPQCQPRGKERKKDNHQSQDSKINNYTSSLTSSWSTDENAIEFSNWPLLPDSLADFIGTLRKSTTQWQQEISTTAAKIKYRRCMICATAHAIRCRRQVTNKLRLYSYSFDFQHSTTVLNHHNKHWQPQEPPPHHPNQQLAWGRPQLALVMWLTGLHYWPAMLH